MAASTLIKEVLYRASDLLHDLNPQFKRWTQKAMVNYLNDGQIAIAKYLPQSCSRVDAVKLSTGTRQNIDKLLAASIKPGDGSTAVDTYGVAFLDILNNMGADGLTPGAAVRVVERDMLDAMDPDWHTRTGSAVEGVAFDTRFPRTFFVTPGVTGNVWVNLAYIAIPAKVPNVGTEDYGHAGTNTTVISISDVHMDDLVNYIMARAYLRDGEVSTSALQARNYTSLFAESINAQVKTATGTNPNLKALPMTPGVPAAES